MPPEINPVKFGEILANVENLQKQTTELKVQLGTIDQKLDTVVQHIAIQKGAAAQRGEYHGGFVIFVSALVSGAFTWVVDIWRHQ